MQDKDVMLCCRIAGAVLPGAIVLWMLVDPVAVAFRFGHSIALKPSLDFRCWSDGWKCQKRQFFHFNEGRCSMVQCLPSQLNVAGQVYQCTWLYAGGGRNCV